MKKVASLIMLAAVTMAFGSLVGCATYAPPSQETSTSDAQIAREAMNRLAADSVAGRYTFTVTVRNGVATVEGSVPDEAFRLRVLGIVGGTPGVTQVLDGLYRM